MAPPEVAVRERSTQGASATLVNDFSIQVATVNGSGSQTANLVLLRSIFGMGIPVSGKKYVSVKYCWIAHVVHHSCE